MQLKTLTVLGLNSGTSMDGVDAAIFRISPKLNNFLSEKSHAENLNSNYLDSDYSKTDKSPCPQLQIENLGQTLYEFEPSFRQKLKNIVSSNQASLDEICRLDAALGEVFSQAALSVMHNSKLTEADIDLIGSHGQTVWHAPEPKFIAGINSANTMQLGEPAIIAQRTGIPVIADFRVQDMAAGGQGAPLVSFVDQVLFGEKNKPIAILNIGGISNLTVLSENALAIMAFDTGPGNILIDRACEKLFNMDFDTNGHEARKGKINDELLNLLLSLAYFKTSPPKTTGRELFSFELADNYIDNSLAKGLSANDILATFTAFTAYSIAFQYRDFVLPIQKINKIVLGGGGAENKYLVELLQKAWPHEVEILSHEDYGISSKFKESLLFAILAYTCYFRIPNNLPICTGAKKQVIMGKLCLP